MDAAQLCFSAVETPNRRAVAHQTCGSWQTLETEKIYAKEERFQGRWSATTYSPSSICFYFFYHPYCLDLRKKNLYQVRKSHLPNHRGILGRSPDVFLYEVCADVTAMITNEEHLHFSTNKILSPRSGQCIDIVLRITHRLPDSLTLNTCLRWNRPEVL